MSIEERKAFMEDLTSILKENNLMVVPAELVAEHEKLKAAQEMLMDKSRNHFTIYEVAKFDLIPGMGSYNEVKNMVKDGRIRPHECFTDLGGKTYILRSGIERLRGRL